MTGRKGKRIACSVLAAMMALSLAACKGSGGQPDTAKGTSDSAAEVSDAASGWTSDNGAEITIMHRIQVHKANKALKENKEVFPAFSGKPPCFGFLFVSVRLNDNRLRRKRL